MKIKKSWLAIFTICIVYWAYLVINTKMPIFHDSVIYEETGKVIYEKGWLAFFKSGPYREPFYPALIALAMSLGEVFHKNYQLVLKIFQVVFLFSAQLLLIKLLRVLNIREWIIKSAVLYFGISPALINAAFSVYYEIVVFPFVVAAVLLASSLWLDIKKENSFPHILAKSILFGLCFIALAFGRDLFQYVFYLFSLPFLCLSIAAIFSKRRKVFYLSAIFLVVAFSIFYSAVSYIKSMNFRYNGNRVLCTTHISYPLASAYKRAEPLTSRIALSHIATIPGNGVCRSFFSQEECDYADFMGMDVFRTTKVAEIMASLPKENQSKEVLFLTVQKVLQSPFQYCFFFSVEALKLPFWESTQIGFVEYPPILSRFYSHPIPRFGLRLLLGIMTIFSFVFVTFVLFSSWFRKKPEVTALYFIWFLILIYTVFYALCVVLTRFALPIASLYIACIGFTINSLVTESHKNEDPA